MSAPRLHLNLLKDEERLTSNPVRLHVMLPILAALALLACALWAAFLGMTASNLESEGDQMQQQIAQIEPSHANLLALRKQIQETHAETEQLLLYQRSRVLFSEALDQIPPHVAPNIQFTELRIPPGAPLFDPLQPRLGPTNKTETVTLRIAGRTSGEQATASVDALLRALRSPAFSNLIIRAEIPPGAFRQDPTRGPEGRDTLLFEIACVCAPRRFE